MPWMRVAAGVGGSAMVTGITGMFFWIDDGSHYFDLAVAVAMAGLLTLVACVLTVVFGSSHGSQDDAFRRGRSMGYDAGFLEGHRTARPVVVPMHAVDTDVEVPDSDIDDPAEWWTVPVTMPVWHRDAWDRVAIGDRMVAWMRARRIPLLAGVLSLTLVAVLAATALARTSVPRAEAFGRSPGTPLSRAVPPSHTTPDLVTKAGPVYVKAPVAAVARGSHVVPAVAGRSAVVPAGARVSAVVPAAAGAVVASTTGASYSPPGQTTLPAVAPAPVTQPTVTPPVSTPAGVPVVPAPVVPLTAAEQTAADAAAAAELTAANAAAAAELTAANAAAAASETARVAAAAAEATRLKAAADAYAVAHPGA